VKNTYYTQTHTTTTTKYFKSNINKNRKHTKKAFNSVFNTNMAAILFIARTTKIWCSNCEWKQLPTSAYAPHLEW